MLLGPSATFWITLGSSWGYQSDVNPLSQFHESGLDALGSDVRTSEAFLRGVLLKSRMGGGQGLTPRNVEPTRRNPELVSPDLS